MKSTIPVAMKLVSVGLVMIAALATGACSSSSESSQDDEAGARLAFTRARAEEDGATKVTSCGWGGQGGGVCCSAPSGLPYCCYWDGPGSPICGYHAP
jgi:hypothetical protein